MTRRPVLSLLACALLAACSGTSQELAGRPGGDETGNGLEAQIVDRQGVPIANALVQIRPNWFLPSENARLRSDSGILDVRTAADGRIRIDSLPLGRYLIQSSDTNDGLLLPFETGTGRQDLGTLQRKPLGDVWGQLDLPRHRPARIRAWGLERTTFTDTLGNFRLNQVPSGRLRLLATDSATDSSLGETEVGISSGFSTKAPPFTAAASPETWNRHAWVDIHMGSDGAGIGETVRDFALLLRLDDSNFPFSQARPDGSDLVAWNPDGTPIPLEISAWDPVARRGRAWLRMDSLPGNKTTSVKLTWGQAPPQRLPVFDTARGWAGVWHFSQFLLDAQGRLRSPDATQWRQDADLIGVGAGTGIVSAGLLFTQTTECARMGSAGVRLGRHSFTWESWVKTDKGYVVLMNKGNGDSIWESGEKKILLADRKYGLHGIGPGLVPSVLHRLNATTNAYEDYSGEVVAGQWTHLAVRQTLAANDSVSVRWFVNGMADTAKSPLFLPEGDDPRDSLWVGLIRSGGHLAIDELQISDIPRSDAWIRLSYLSQSPSSSLVRIRQTR